MRIKQILESTTTAGSVASFAKPLATQTRENTNVRGLKPVQQVMSDKAKKQGPYANSLSEGKMKDLNMDLRAGKDGLSDIEFKKKYSKTKEEMRKAMQDSRKEQKVNEADLSEDDLILVPGIGRKLKSGFIKHDPDRAEHEGQTLKNSLHTIIRVATHLDKELSVRDNFPEWVSEKIGAVKSNIVTVMDYLISAKEMQHDPDAMNEGENRVDSLVLDALKIMRGSEVSDAVSALKTVLGDREYNGRRGFYNFYVKQLMNMHSQQGVAEGARTSNKNKKA